MQFSQITSFGLFSLAVASPITKRTAATIETDIATIATELIAFDTAINKSIGTLVTALPVLAAYNTLDTAVNTATSVITSTGTLDSSDSATIYAAVTTLTTQIASTLTDAKAQYSVAESSGYVDDVCEAIGTLYIDTNSLYEALSETIDSAYTDEFTALKTTADTDFAATIGVYGC